MESLSRLPEVTQLVSYSPTCLPHWKTRFTSAELQLRPALLTPEPLGPEQCATRTTVQAGCETAEARSQRRRDDREAWREAVGEMMEGLKGPPAVEDKPGWGAALRPAGVWWSGHSAKKGKLSLTDST